MIERLLLNDRTALSSALAGAVGGFVGGFVMSRMKLGPVAAVKLLMITAFPFVMGIAIFLFLGCSQINMAGHIDPHHGR